jgi:hypothetical protein
VIKKRNTGLVEGTEEIPIFYIYIKKIGDFQIYLLNILPGIPYLSS